MSDKRQAILDTATRLFGSHGYQAIGVDRIIAESGVAKMTLYKHFPSKSDLIVQVLTTREAELAEQLMAFVSAQAGELDRVRAVFDWHDQWIRSDVFSGCMFINASSELASVDPMARAVAMRQKRNMERYFETLVTPLVGPEAAPYVADQASLLLDGAIVSAQVRGDLSAAPKAWAIMERLIEPLSKRGNRRTPPKS